MALLLKVSLLAHGVDALALPLTRRGLLGVLVASVPPRQQDLTAIGLETPAVRDADEPFKQLDSGVKVQTLRPGSGPDVVSAGSTIFIECTGRFLNLNGCVFF